MWIHLALSPLHDLHGLCHGSGSQSPVSHHKVLGKLQTRGAQTDTGTGFSLSTLNFPCQ